MNRARAFLSAYRRTGNVSQAAAAAGIERQLHYRRLKVDPAYQTAFADAHAEALEMLRYEAERRADKIHALEIASVDARVQALQDRWNDLRRGIRMIVEERGADMVDVPGGRSGYLCRDFKGKNADREISKVDPGIVALLGELRAHEKMAAEQLGQWTTRNEHAGLDGAPLQSLVTVRFVSPDGSSINRDGSRVPGEVALPVPAEAV